MRRRLAAMLRLLLAALLGVWLSCGGLPVPLAGAGLPGVAAAQPLALDREAIPLARQPFYPQLQQTEARWRHAPLAEVVAASPRETLLNFYVVMADVGREMRAIDALAERDPGWRWSEAVRRRIAVLDQRFTLAVEALDASAFPESIRADRADEAAMQLKQVLDYVFSTSQVPIEMPDALALRELNSRRNKSRDAWTIPRTGITLTSEVAENPTGMSYLFSIDTVEKAAAMYHHIKALPIAASDYATPGLYHDYVSSPGFLVPPKWYLRMPRQLRQLLEISFAEQTLFQIAAAALTLLIYGAVISLLLIRLLRTYHYLRRRDRQQLSTWTQDHVSWLRVLLVLPALPLTWLSDKIIGDLVNFTGLPLAVLTYLFFCLYFFAASLFAFYLFEALGRSLAEWMVRLRGGGSELQLRRVGNLVLPICRVLGGLVALALIYRLLILLGLPSSTVLAFSAVPGLAIGLGASKLLGNLFAGLSIQTDRPVRVGEFCRIGASQGFVTRIGLRSLELQTLESRVTIPNGIVDEETIINFSSRQDDAEAPLRQSLELRLPIPSGFSSDQIGDLLALMRLFAQEEEYHDPLLSIDQASGADCALLFSALVHATQWSQYLSLREQVLRRFDEICEQVVLCSRKIGVSFGTGIEQLRRIPDLIATIVAAEPQLDLRSCRLMQLSDYSYDFSIRLLSHHPSLRELKDAIHRFNQELIACFAIEGIEIPFPTATSHQIRMRP